MIEAYRAFLAEPTSERKDVYEAAADRLGTRGEFVEKDLWVCLALELLFGRNPPPCGMTFKGGTSLSKAFGLIKRFSEDIDIVLSPKGLGVEHDIDYLRTLSGKRLKSAFEALVQVSAGYVGNELKPHLEADLRRLELAHVQVDVDPQEDQTLLLSYASVYTSPADYVRPTVRIECGPRSAHEPAAPRSVTPYVSAVGDFQFEVSNVPTIKAERTFWEKLFILHGHHCRFRDEQLLPRESNRLSRHYYDVAMLGASECGTAALADTGLLEAVRSHNQLAFPAAWRKYEEGSPGRFVLVPQLEVREVLAADYRQMQAMIFGEVPEFSEILAQIERLEARLNSGRL